NAIVRAQGITRERKGDVRCLSRMARDGISAGGIHVELRGIDGRALGGSDNGTVWDPLRGDAIVLHDDLAHAASGVPVFDENFPRARLRVAVGAVDGDDAIDELAIHLRPDDA